MDPLLIAKIQKGLADLQNQMTRHKHVSIDGTTPVDKTAFITFSLPDTQSQTATNFGLVFVATRPCSVKALSEVHTVAGTSGSAVTLQLEKIQGTTAPGSGTTLLANAFNLKGTANTVQRGVIDPKASVGLAEGDRLAMKVAGTLTSLKGVCVTIEITFT